MTPRNDQYLEKPLPSNEDAERIILGAILMDNDMMPHAAEKLMSGDFYSPFTRRIFGAMLALHNSGRGIDPIRIGEELKKEGSLDGIGGVSTITNLTLGIPHFTRIGEYVDIVRKKARVRDLIRTCNSIVGDALAEEDDPDTTIVEAQTKINDLCLRAAIDEETEGFIPLSSVITQEVMPGLDDLKTGRAKKISTGFEVIDSAIGGGLSTSDVMLLAGLPSSGKSALALQIAYNVAASGVPAAFLAGEMTNKENVFRLLAQVSEFQNPNGITHITSEEHKFLTAWAESIRDVPLYLDHRTSDVHGLAARLRAIVRQKGIKVLVIDYIQLLKVEKVDKRKRFERITEASQEVKRLANELDIAVISVAQFNREGAKSGKPSMHDLESSSQLEKDASLVLIIDRDEVDHGAVNIRVVKGRNSGVSSFSGRFKGRCVKFEF